MSIVTSQADSLISAIGTVCRAQASLMFLKSMQQYPKHLELFFLPAKPRLLDLKDITTRGSLDADLLIRAGKGPVAPPEATAKIVG